MMTALSYTLPYNVRRLKVVSLNSKSISCRIRHSRVYPLPQILATWLWTNTFSEIQLTDNTSLQYWCEIINNTLKHLLVSLIHK